MRHPGRLDALRIVTSCDVPWASMKGDEAKRFCGKCRQNVYDVAALSADEAIALIERAEGRVCLRLTRRPDGRLVTGDCWAVLRRARRRGLVAFAFALPVVLGATLWAQAFGLRTLFEFLRDRPCDVRTRETGLYAPPAPLSRTMGVPAPGTLQRHVFMGKLAGPPRDLR